MREKRDESSQFTRHQLIDIFQLQTLPIGQLVTVRGQPARGWECSDGGQVELDVLHQAESHIVGRNISIESGAFKTEW